MIPIDVYGSEIRAHGEIWSIAIGRKLFPELKTGGRTSIKHNGMSDPLLTRKQAASRERSIARSIGIKSIQHSDMKRPVINYFN